MMFLVKDKCADIIKTIRKWIKRWAYSDEQKLWHKHKYCRCAKAMADAAIPLMRKSYGRRRDTVDAQRLVHKHQYC